MKYLQIAVMGVLTLTFFAVAADAQKRKKTVTKKPVVAKTVLPPLEVRVAREKVDTQLANVNTFLDKFGPIAQSVEILDTAAAAGRLKKPGIDKNELTKQKLIVAIRDLKAAFAPVESEFRTKPLLQKYLASIQGITDLAAQAEDLAIVGKFVAAKDPLRKVATKLADTLAVMPFSPPL